MATVYRCDRCGKIDDHKLHALQTTWLQTPANVNSSPQIKDYDLCASCIGAFNVNMKDFITMRDPLEVHE